MGSIRTKRKDRHAFRASIWIAALSLPLAACGSETKDGANANASASSPAVSSASAPAKAPPSPASAKAKLMLGGQGLIVEPSDGAPQPLAFGSLRTATSAGLASALGSAPSKRGTNAECGAGAQDFETWDGQLTAWFQDGKFVGWQSAGNLASANGWKIGSRRSDIAGIKVEDSSIGTEFTASGMSGLLESKGADAKVTELWAGSTCIFR
jgi:hypothetical protein